METITLTGRDSKLSRIQIELVKTQLLQAFPDINVLVKTSSSLGDRLQHIPLQTVQGTDFFTEEVFENLYTGEADIAVHSLKDMSAAHFFGGNIFAVVDRDEVRDIAIFNPNALDRIKANQVISIGTCSPRRELMATRFLKKALPQFGNEIQIQTKVIRGNVDTRLRKLNDGEYDGIILAAAGLNRLLQHPEHNQSIKPLLQSKKLMALPLIECTPAPCQGAIVAEALAQNKKAVDVLSSINKVNLLDQCIHEKKTALQYGAGCDQKFGVATVAYATHEATFASGMNEVGSEFTEWSGLPEIDVDGKTLWDGSTIKTSSAESVDVFNDLLSDIAFISNDRAVNSKMESELSTKRVWAAGSKTWFKLAKKAIWVEGCTDGLGLESLSKVWESPLFSIKKEDVTILTHEKAAANWKTKGWKALGTYRSLANKNNASAQANQIQSADILFWSSATQFNQLKHLTKKTAIHVCASGETFTQLKSSDVEPLVFPTIESFHQWKSNIIPSPIEG
jgi:hydroxymethylbilane synthase